MKKTDITAIKLNSPAFTRKWWEEHRGILAHGCGVGKALEQWQKTCPANPELIKDAKLVEKCKDAAVDLKAALAKAQKRTATLDKDTAKACETYKKLIEGYEAKLGLGLTEMDDDAEVWKKILVAMPKAIGEMVKMSKDIDGAKKDLGRYEETAKLLIERAKARNKMSSQSRDDLLGALEELQKAVGKVSKFTNEEAVRITRFADPVFDLEEKLRGRTHEKDIRAMHEKVIAAGKLEGSLRDRLTEVVTQVAEAEALIKQTVKTVERIKDMMETRMTMFWDSPVGGAKTLNDTLLDVKQRVKAILGADPLKLDESAKRQLVQAMRKLDNERLQLDSNITNLGNILRSVVSETKQFTSDKKIVEQIKEMAATYNLLNGEYKKIDVDIAKADKKIQEMAG